MKGTTLAMSAVRVELPIDGSFATGSSWDTPAADFGERMTTVEPESLVRLIPLAPSVVAKIKHV